MRHKSIITVATCSILALGPLATADASPRHEQRPVQSVSSLQMFTSTHLERVINEGLQFAMPYINDPEKFSAEFSSYLKSKGYSENIALPVESSGVSNLNSSSAIPAVIIAARFAFCVSSAYTILVSIPANASYVDKAMWTGAAIAGCVGGGSAGTLIGQWILKNPRIAQGVFASVGLLHLTGDSRRK